ncbi:hypothetical protein BDEG_26578 [Batrachochytrium dendrobatidis JEL423]|uniref:Uncharacterized protein n=1 Tax=Batrachochytrium dendrobatidis (strain JEL423) TaxID=403673 RepID=A0A177WTF8_BATDL|nr:hypothetical protein BDEG_26578 [Batrachochytrium dendrobatidis JEL423]
MNSNHDHHHDSSTPNQNTYSPYQGQSSNYNNITLHGHKLTFASTQSTSASLYILQSDSHQAHNTTETAYLKLSELDALFDLPHGHVQTCIRSSLHPSYSPLYEAGSGDILLQPYAFEQLAPLINGHGAVFSCLAGITPESVLAGQTTSALASRIHQYNTQIINQSAKPYTTLLSVPVSQSPVSIVIVDPSRPVHQQPLPLSSSGVAPMAMSPSRKRTVDEALVGMTSGGIAHAMDGRNNGSDSRMSMDADHHCYPSGGTNGGGDAELQSRRPEDEMLTPIDGSPIDPVTSNDLTTSESGGRLQQSSRTRKRLSIDTTLHERNGTETNIAEGSADPAKSAGIIDATQKYPSTSRANGRGRQSGLTSIRSDVSSWASLSSSVDHLISPYGEFPNRELPLPRGFNEHPRTAHPLSTGTSRHFPPVASHTKPPANSSISVPSSLAIPSFNPATAPVTSTVSASHPSQYASQQQSTPLTNKPHLHSGPLSTLPLSISRSAFTSIFESVYDQHENQARLQATLKEQIRKSATLLQTLQTSGQMIEGLVRGHFREMQCKYGEKFGAALTDLNRRLAAVEEKVGLGSINGSDAFTAGGALKSARPYAGGSNGTSGDNEHALILSAILTRLDTLEKRTLD